jgi:hypothetical protein
MMMVGITRDAAVLLAVGLAAEVLIGLRSVGGHGPEVSAAIRERAQRNLVKRARSLHA